MSENVLPDTLAKEDKQDDQIVELVAIKDKLTELDAAFDAEDFSSEATQSDVLAKLIELTTQSGSGITTQTIQFYQTMSMMQRLLVQLKLMNVHLASITGDEIDTEDIED